MLVSLASLNNILHIYVSYGSYDFARIVLNKVSIFLQEHNACLFLTEAELHEILLNVLFLKLPPTIAPAA